jgi:hypothetical protein
MLCWQGLFLDNELIAKFQVAWKKFRDGYFDNMR